MNDYKAVRSSTEISRRIADLLELADPAGFRPGSRPETIRRLNDVLQGRCDTSTDALLAELKEKAGEDLSCEVETVREDVLRFQHQKDLLTTSYGKSWDLHYIVMPPSSRPPLNVVDQELFDRAAEKGFPIHFFQNAYFDRVTIYCLPEGTDFSFSVLQSCTFAVCRIETVNFTNASLQGCEFHSSILSNVDFLGASIAHTHFHDSTLDHVYFTRARMKRCNVIDCSLSTVAFGWTLMDGCFFGRVQPKEIHELKYATITQGGATEEECRRNKESIFQALGVEQEAK